MLKNKKVCALFVLLNSVLDYRNWLQFWSLAVPYILCIYKRVMVFFWRLTGLEVIRNCFCSFPAISATDGRLIRLCRSIYFWGSLKCNKIPQAEWLKHWKLIFPYFLSLKVKSRDTSSLVSFVTFLLGSWVLVFLACPYMVTPLCVVCVLCLRSFSCQQNHSQQTGCTHVASF